MPRRNASRDELPPKPPGWSDELVVLEGGPRDGWWYFVRDWSHTRRAAERVGSTDGVMAYRPTRAHRGHPKFATAGKVWRFAGSAA